METLYTAAILRAICFQVCFSASMNLSNDDVSNMQRLPKGPSTDL